MDRVLLWNYYMIPAWHNDAVRVAYWDRFSRPKIIPKYHGLDITSWWFDKEKDARLTRKSEEKSPITREKPSLWSKIRDWSHKIGGSFF